MAESQATQPSRWRLRKDDGGVGGEGGEGMGQGRAKLMMSPVLDVAGILRIVVE